MPSFTKNPHPPSKKFFFRVPTRRLVASFDASTRSVTRTGVEIFPRKATCFYAFFFRKSLKAAGCQRVKKGSKWLTRPLQAWDDDRKHGRDMSAAVQRPRPACLIGWDACEQFSSPKDTLHIFPCHFFMAVSNTSSPSLHLKHGALHSKYMSLGIERQFFFKWKML